LAPSSASTSRPGSRPETSQPRGYAIRMTDDVIAEVTRNQAEYGLPGAGKPISK
jgi:hypothetical protein